MLDYSHVEILYGIVDYAMQRLRSSGDLPAVEYLNEQLIKVRFRIENERTGGGDMICTQIDNILGILGDDDG
jgi:hypothetical protein